MTEQQGFVDDPPIVERSRERESREQRGAERSRERERERRNAFNIDEKKSVRR
jgi:hypothetical protein